MEEEPLQTKYSCQMTNCQTLDVTMEMLSRKMNSQTELPVQYVLVLDVSGSMEDPIGNRPEKKIERLQYFAKLAIQTIEERDWMAIVTFSSEQNLTMPMKKVNLDSKMEAWDEITKLESDGGTNLEKGLMGALKAIEETKDVCQLCRYCIVVFTDGGINEGKTDAKDLVEQFRQEEEKLGLRTCVPISVCTIGQHRPDLLIEASRKLGNEAFYWFSDVAEFEVDMLLPIILRKTISISDVDIKMVALSDSYFHSVGKVGAHLKETIDQTSSNEGNRPAEKVTKLSFFIHTLPEDNAKHIDFQVALPKMPPKELDGIKVVEITIQYLDAELKQRKIQDYIVAKTKGRSVAQHSVFVIFQNLSIISVEIEAEVYIKIAAQKFKKAIVEAIENAKLKMVSSGETTDDLVGAQEILRRAKGIISSIFDDILNHLPDSGESLEKIRNIRNEWDLIADYAIELAGSGKYSQLLAMMSSIYSEMPTVGGIFCSKQPFMSTRLETELVEQNKIVEDARNIDSSDTVNSAIRNMNKLIKAGNLLEMKRYLKVLLGVLTDGDILKHFEREIEHRKRLDEVKERLKDALEKEDFSLVTDLLAKDMKALREETDLMFTEEDKAALQRASHAVIEPLLTLPPNPLTMSSITQAMDYLDRLKNFEQDFGDVFSYSDNVLLEVVLAKVDEVRKQLHSISYRLKEISPLLALPKQPSNYDSICEAVKKMEKTLEEAQKYDGFPVKQEEEMLKVARERMDSLAKEREQLVKRIHILIPVLELDVLPVNYRSLCEAVNEITWIRQTAVLFRSVFLDDYDIILKQASTKVATLDAKKEDLEIRIEESIANAKLPQLPENLEKLKEAVTSLNLAKQESKGFEDVFTDEHVEVLISVQSAISNLEAEKERISKKRDECLQQIQLSPVPSNYEKINEGISIMERTHHNMKGFGLYEDSYDSLLKAAYTNKDMLEDKRNLIQKQLQDIRPSLRAVLTPNNLKLLRNSVEEMRSLKEESLGFGDVFTTSNETDLFEAETNLKYLIADVEKMYEARQNLNEAMRSKNYTLIKQTVRRARRAPFIERAELKEPKRLLFFLDPKKRCAALKIAIELESIEEIEEALFEMKEANVVDDKLEKEAKQTIKRLEKQRKKGEREKRKAKNEQKKRKLKKKGLKGDMKEALLSRDIEMLEQAMDEFEESGFKESEIPEAKEAKELLRHLKIERTKKRLLNALKERKLKLLIKALAEAKRENYIQHMELEFKEARELLKYIVEMMRLHKEIMKMSNRQISEVRSYFKPPNPIKKTMQAIFTLLGESPRGIKKWDRLRALMDQSESSSMTNRLKRFNIQDLPPERAKKAEEFLRYMKLDDVKIASRVAGSFYAWAKCVIKESKRIQNAENVRKVYDSDVFESDDESDEEDDEDQEEEIRKSEVEESNMPEREEELE